MNTPLVPVSMCDTMGARLRAKLLYFGFRIISSIAFIVEVMASNCSGEIKTEVAEKRFGRLSTIWEYRSLRSSSDSSLALRRSGSKVRQVQFSFKYLAIMYVVFNLVFNTSSPFIGPTLRRRMEMVKLSDF